MGHPDKVADRLSDAIVDRVLASDPAGRVACEILISGRRAILAGEISGSDLPGEAELERLARETIAEIGYDSWDTGFDAAEAEVLTMIKPQAADIARGVDAGDDGELGAGDQGMMFGYATNQTPELMPLPIMLAHRLVAQQSSVRRTSTIPGLRPDAKAQVTVEYEDSEPAVVTSVLLSTQHGPEWNERQGDLRAAVLDEIVRPVLGDWWDGRATLHVNPTGRFEMGGPLADTGLTGRKIIVDTYGGWARHGGGAFSGKDPTKVDRSASYMARHIAKNVVASGLAAECEVRLSYAIGVAQPTSVFVDCRGTQEADEAAIERAVREVFPLTPAGIISTLDLSRPIYAPTACHGHFGREPGEAGDGTFTWERTDRVEALLAALTA
jgi:S-adenosylmethionine synthetase